MDPGLRHPVPPGCGRHLDRPDRPDHADHGAGADRCLGRDRQAGQPVLRRVHDPRRPDDRRVQRARRAAVLRVLRRHADPDVHHHRRVGRPAPCLCLGQVLPVHLPRLGVHAGRVDLPVPEGRQLAAGRHGRVAADDDRADLAVLRVPGRVRGQGADVPGAHLVAGRACRGADRRLGDPGGDHAQDRRLRLPALRPADRP